MKLSDIQTTVVYETTLPSSKKKVKFRPFFVKEERALLTAYESEDSSTMLSTLVSVVKACINSKVDYLTTYDVEYMFLQIRAKSVGEMSNVLFNCSKCGESTPVEFDIREAKVENGDKTKQTIKLTDNIIVNMRYPHIDDLVEIDTSGNPKTILRKAIGSCIESIVYGDEILKVKDEPIEEIEKFLDNLTGAQFGLLKKFVDSNPVVKLKVDWECRHCKSKEATVLSGIYNFF